ncbi:uncharacterized protein LOC129214646 isoform X3 [Grus americana]|uniref:uncharacterized protein LOC129214646 isoform X3 n=1 Tax=Grus americana TaxID=9117 RepID=UPI0024080CF5|nr:uncharacterized protein LOC129214646 isoform X3 [Grus americana]
MAGKEPLLSAFKGGVLQLREGGGPCTDTSPHLASLCQLLESILRKGLRQPAWGFRRRDYWHWLEQLPAGDGSRPTPLSISIQKAGSCEKVQTAQGHGRYFLRLALQGKVLAAAVRELARTPRLLEFYDPVSSILGNEDLLEPFLSLLLVVTEMDFSLDLQNCSFLDESWLLPVCITYETVPCRVLGMVLRYVDGRVFVTEVLPESQAEVDEVVLAGDILDEINGCSLRNAYSGQAALQPAVPGPDQRWDGEYGGKEVLDQAIPAVLERHVAPREVLFDVKEAEVLVQEKTSSKLLCRYPYPTISCVGRCMDSSNVFAFCVAASPESPDGSVFDCLVFASSSEQECEEIIKRIAAGFKHTEWFV